MPEPMIKGAAVREVFAWLRQHLGDRAFEAALSKLPPEDQKRFDLRDSRLGLLTGAWYQAPTVHRMLDALTEGMSREERRRLAYQASEASLVVTLTGIHRALLRLVGSPDLHRRFVTRLWDAYFNNGRVLNEKVSDHEVLISYSGWTAHHTFVCDVTTASDIVIFGAMGLKNVHVTQVRCVSDGDADCAHSVAWS